MLIVLSFGPRSHQLWAQSEGRRRSGASAQVRYRDARDARWTIFESIALRFACNNAIMGDGSVSVERVASVTAPTLVIDCGIPQDAERRADPRA